MKKPTRIGNTNRLTHGMSYSSEFYIWRSMKARCTNPKAESFLHYGARGITVCDSWISSFENFFSDMGKRPTPKHQLDRINNDGPYSPENCKWSTIIEQARNKRTSKLITFNGKTLMQSEWARLLGVNRSTVGDRIKKGWSIKDAVTTPRTPRNLRRKKPS